MNLFRTIRDRVFKSEKKGKKLYQVEYTIYHDGNMVSRFNLNIRANSRAHAWTILSRFVEIKATEIKYLRSL